MDLMDYLKKNAEEVDNAIEREFGKKDTDLYRAGAHLLLAGGKRLRPAVMMLAADLVDKGSSGGLIPAALAIEMTHTFTLIHDDIMDSDSVRRGSPTVHTVWDEPTAILAGDMIYSLAYEYLCNSEGTDTSKVKAVSMLGRVCAEICEGQEEDMSFESRNDVTEEEYLEMVRKKTGALYAASAAIGGMLAGGSVEQVEALNRYGMESGISFQIQDDLIDLITPAEKSGKDQASDIREGKQTLIAIKAREKGIDLTPYRRELSNDEINEVITILDEKGIIREVRRIAEEKLGSARDALSIFPESDEKKLLLDVIDYFVSRGY